MQQDDSDASNMDDTHTIVQFLQRPVKLDYFKIKPGTDTPLKPVVFKYTSTDVQQPVKEYQFPRDLMLKGNKLEKMANHQYFKADIHIKVVLNANPFVTGRYYLTYSPYEDQVSNTRKQRSASRAGVTAYPGVEIDAQLDNSVEIVIPFASYKEAYVLTSDQPEDFVRMFLFCISPCRVGKEAVPESTGIDFTIYGWFENITINIPTLKEIPLLEERMRQRYGHHTVKKELTQSPPEPENPYLVQLTNLQQTNPAAYNRVISLLSGRTQRMPRSVEEVWDVPGHMQIQAEAQANGPISSIASAVSTGADAIGNLPIISEIPIVKEVAPIVGWAADIVGGLASIFGWSKPQRMEPVLELANLPAKNYAHTTNIDNSVSLSLSNQNELERPDQIFPSAVDEMDLEYICNNPAIKYVIPWKAGGSQQRSVKNGTAATTLKVIPVGMAPFDRYTQVLASGKQSNLNLNVGIIDGRTTISPRPANNSTIDFVYDVGATILDTTPCEYVSQLFTYWRATMCYKISVVKTAFHVGRLEIFFDPGKFQFDGNVFYDDVETANNYKYILDLTNDSEVTIKIPFVSEQLVKSTIGVNAPTGEVAPPIWLDNVLESSIGALVIRPLSDLLAPETVSDTVDIVVWKWAENVVLSTPKPPTDTEIRVYEPTVTEPKYELTIEDVYNAFPWGNRDPTLTAAAAISTLPLECRVRGHMQINIGNKADGNVETFFNTKNPVQDAMMVCKNVVGERIINMRPLLRAFRYIGDATLVPQIPLILNWQNDTTQIPKTARNQAGMTKTSPDYSSFLSYMYRFFRGGNRYKIFTNVIQNATQADSDALTRVTSTLVKTAYNEAKDLQRVVENIHTGPTHMTFPKLNPVHEITVPFYSKFRKLPISILDNIHMPAIVSTQSMDCQVLRAGNDDLTFGWLMGTPQLTVGEGGVQLRAWNASAYDPADACPSYIRPRDPHDHTQPRDIQARPQGHFSDPTPDEPPQDMTDKAVVCTINFIEKKHKFARLHGSAGQWPCTRSVLYYVLAAWNKIALRYGADPQTWCYEWHKPPPPTKPWSEISELIKASEGALTMLNENRDDYDFCKQVIPVGQLAIIDAAKGVVGYDKVAAKATPCPSQNGDGYEFHQVWDELHDGNSRFDISGCYIG